MMDGSRARGSFEVRRDMPRLSGMSFTFVMVLLAQGHLVVLAQRRKVEPTWLHRDVSALHEQRTDLTSNSCHYKPIFGEGDVAAQLPKSIARFGEVTVDARGACQAVEYPGQEELYFVREGSGELRYGEE